MSSDFHEAMRQERPGAPRATLAMTLRSGLLAASLALIGVSGALAQESTPETMAGAECVAPATAAEADAASTMASPEADAATGESAPADDALAAEITAAVENYTACYNSGDFASVLALSTPNYLLDAFGTDDVAMLESALSMSQLPPVTFLWLGNVQTHADGRVSIDGESITGDHQYLKTRTFFVRSGDTLLVDGEDYLPSTADVGEMAIISFTIADDTAPLAFDQTTTLPAIEGLTLYGANNGAERHTVALLRLADETAGTPLAELPASELTSGELVGAIPIEPGERGELVLLNLEPGSYLLIDAQVPGSAAPLTITEPEPES